MDRNVSQLQRPSWAYLTGPEFMKGRGVCAAALAHLVAGWALRLNRSSDHSPLGRSAEVSLGRDMNKKT